MSSLRSPAPVGLLAGCAALALILGAYGFQYLGRLPPCEMCWWQRYPHIAAAMLGIAGYVLVSAKVLPQSWAKPCAWLTIFLVAASGAIGVYHAGVEWHWWAGPSACTGPAFHGGGALDLNAPVVMCDHAAWRLFGLSLAGYNALLSFGIAATGASLLVKQARSS